MYWILYALYAAIGFGLVSIIAKKILKNTSTLVYTSIFNILALTFYSPFFLYFITDISVNYTNIAVIGLAFSIMGNISGFFIYNFAIKNGELSKVSPLSRLTPIFTAIIATVVLSEEFTTQLVASVILASIGGTLIVLENLKLSSISPNTKFISRASLLALVSAIIYSGTAVADRFATRIIEPQIYTYFIFIGLATGFSTGLIIRNNSPIQQIRDELKNYPKYYLLSGLIAATSSYGIFKAFSMASAAKVVTIQQFQLVITVIAGIIIYKEKNLLQKFIGSLIIIAAIIITTF